MVEYYRCLKCRKKLIPLKDEDTGEDIEFAYRGKPLKYGNKSLSRGLQEAGFTHLCENCMIAYTKDVGRDYSKLKENKCPKCGGKLVYLPVYGDIKNFVPCCERCDIAFLPDPEGEEETGKTTKIYREGKEVKIETR